MVSSLFVIISETGASSVDCTLAGWLGWASFTSTNRLRLFLEFGWLKVFIPVDGGRNGAERGERSPSAPSRFAGRCSVASAAALFPLPSPDREVAGNRSIPFDHDASDRRWNGGSFRYVASSQLLLSPLLLLLPVGKESIPTKEKMAAAPLSTITNDFLPFYFATAQPLARTFFSKKYRYIRTVIVNTFHGKGQRKDKKTSVEGKQRRGTTN